jgi:hypothetical protein
MMKEVEKMSKLSVADRNELQSIQEGISGMKPINDEWIKATIKTLKTKPALIKSFCKGKGQAAGKMALMLHAQSRVVERY